MTQKAKPVLPKVGEAHTFLVGKKCYAVVLTDDLEDLSSGKKIIDWKNISFRKRTKADKARDEYYAGMFAC